MAETLKSFLVNVGFAVDTDSQSKAEAAVKKTEAKITSNEAEENEKRKKLEDKAGARREKLAIDADKRERQRRADSFKDLSKHVTQFEAVSGRVSQAVGLVGAAFLGSKVFGAIAGTAEAYSRLAVQSQRTQTAPGKIAALTYALTQLGVDRGQAEGSFNGFSDALQKKPGFRNLLAGKGIRTRDDKGNDLSAGDIFENLGPYFKSLPQNVALGQAGSLGIGHDAMLALERQSEFKAKVGEFGKIQGAFGLDPEKAAKEGRDFTAAYDKVAADLLAIKDRTESEFFKPFTGLLNELSKALEANGSTITKITVPAFGALAAILTLKVIPPLLRITGIIAALQPLLAALVLGASAVAIENAAKGKFDQGFNAVTGGPPTDDAKAMQKEGIVGTAKRLWNDRPSWAGGNPQVSPMDGLRHRGGRSRPRTTVPDLTNYTGSNADVTRQAAKTLGTTPEDLATVIAYETKGTFSPAIHGGTGNRYQGLIQFGGPERATYGANDKQTYAQQMRAVVSYLKSRGYKPGMSLTDLYSTINAGQPGHPNASDGHGTVATHVARMQREQAANVRKFLGATTGESKLPPGFGSAYPPPGPVYPASGPGSYAEVMKNKNPFGGLVPVTPATNRPLGDTESARQSISSSSRGDSTFAQTNHFNVNGPDVESVAKAVKATARRGGQDYIRNLEGSSQ